MQKPHYNVVIATPANSFTPVYLRSLLMTIHFLNKEGVSWNFLSQGGSLVAMAREITIGGYNTNDANMREIQNGAFTYDKIFWIDSDISWDPSDFFKLYNSDKDIVSGCYLLADRTCPVYDKPRGLPMPEDELLSKNDLFKVVGAGFGFITMKSGVFEKMPRPWFGPVGVPSIDEKTGEQKEDFLLIGEDLAWSTKAIKCGFDIWVDPSVRVGHQKTFELNWKR